MKSMVSTAVMVCFMAVAATAQTNNPVASSLRKAYAEQRDYVIRSAEKLPPDLYGMRPGAQTEVRTFGQILGHVANTNYDFCSQAKGEKNPMSNNNLEKLTSKPEIVKALKDSFAYCDTAYNSLTDASGSAVITVKDDDGKPMQVPRISLLISEYGHISEHYGNLVTYMRIKSIVPPSSEPQPSQGH